MRYLIAIVLTGFFCRVSSAVAAASPGIDVKFHTALNLIFVPVSVNGLDSGEFIYDTGQEHTIIDASLAQSLGLKIVDPQPTAVPGGTVMVGSIADASLNIAGAKADHLTIQAAPIGFLGGVIGHKISGVLGHDYIQRFSSKIDYKNSTLTIWNPSAFRYSGRGTVVPVTFEADQTFLPIAVKPHHAAAVIGKFKLDTGSVDILGMNNNFVRDEHLFSEGETRIQMPGIAFGGETKGYLLRFESVSIAGTTFPNPFVGYTVDSKGFENRNDAGTVGSALLSRFTVYLDYARNRVIFESTGAATEIKYERVGVMLRAEDADLRDVFVYAVITGSAAARAGILAEDHIIAVNGQKGLSLGQIWALCQNDGTLKLELRRKDGLHTVIVPTADLLPKQS